MSDPQSDKESTITETPAMTVWPSIAAYPLGQKVGKLCAIGAGRFFSIGKLMALVTIPVSLALFFWRLAPGIARRYVLTDKRVVVRKGLGGVEAEAIGLEEFDSILVEVLPGQPFFRAGDLVFQNDGKELLRLAGIQHPEGFRRACLRGQAALASVHRVVAEQTQRTEAAGVS